MVGLASRRYTTYKAPGFSSYPGGGGGATTEMASSPPAVAPVSTGGGLADQRLSFTDMSGGGDNAGRDGPPGDPYSNDGVSSSRENVFSDRAPTPTALGLNPQVAGLAQAVVPGLGYAVAAGNIANTVRNADFVDEIGMERPGTVGMVGGMLGRNGLAGTRTDALNRAESLDDIGRTGDYNAGHATPESDRSYTFSTITDQTPAEQPAGTPAPAGGPVESTSLEAPSGESGGGGAGGGFGPADSGGDYGGAGPGFNYQGGVIDDSVVPGDPPGPDDRYIAAQSGEYMIRRAAAQKLGQHNLRKLNSGNVSGPMLAKALAMVAQRKSKGGRVC